MNREEYIKLLIRLFRLKYKPDETDLELVRQALDAIPDKNTLLFSPIESQPIPRPIRPEVVMYGVEFPQSYEENKLND